MTKSLNISATSTMPVNHGVLFQLFCKEPLTISKRSKAIIPVNLFTEFPVDYCMIIVNLKHGLINMAGVIDADYRGELNVICYNITDTEISLKK
ncbi:deoxyuridine 5'-triphosphate nucleotidohydrolase, partial [Pseudoloma neurophilia]